MSSGKWASFFPFQSQLFSQPPPPPPPPCVKDGILRWPLVNTAGAPTEHLQANVWVWTFFGESFFTFLASSLRGCSGIEGGGGDACFTAELLRSLPPEWVDDSEVVRERRPGPICNPENTGQNKKHVHSQFEWVLVQKELVLGVPSHGEASRVPLFFDCIQKYEWMNEFLKDEWRMKMKSIIYSPWWGKKVKWNIAWILGMWARPSAKGVNNQFGISGILRLGYTGQSGFYFLQQVPIYFSC